MWSTINYEIRGLTEFVTQDQRPLACRVHCLRQVISHDVENHVRGVECVFGKTWPVHMAKIEELAGEIVSGVSDPTVVRRYCLSNFELP